VRLILDAARDLLGESAAEAFVPDLATVQAAQTQRLFEVANQALEITVLDPGFRQELQTMLAADGYDPVAFEDDPLEAFEEADCLWKNLASPE
jgi:hypothetical protein